MPTYYIISVTTTCFHDDYMFVNYNQIALGKLSLYVKFAGFLVDVCVSTRPRNICWHCAELYTKFT